MTSIQSIKIPPDSLLAGFGKPQDYRDCFSREVAGSVTLAHYIERFYCSAAFRPERVILGLLGSGASDSDAQALARGDADGIAVWELVDRREDQILLLSKDTGTASWLAVEPLGERTKLLFGSWVGKPERPIMAALYRLHRLYSRILLGGAARNLT